MCLRLFPFFLLTALIILPGCWTLKNTSTRKINNRFFKQAGRPDSKDLFVKGDEDQVKIFRINSEDFTCELDSSTVEIYPLIVCEKDIVPRITFHEKGFEMNFIMLPLKFRPAAKGVPSQLNCDFNGSIYTGFSKNRYNIDYLNHKTGLYVRNISKYEFSYGIYLGIGNTFISPTTTNHATDDEYDGVVLQKGIAVCLGYNNLKAGIAVGMDNLLGKDRKSWIYENRPYLAFTLGFNIE
ncbi:MAG: hypothetical protein PHI70_04185 [Proteiniphilum sp.]|nr:hypothetical protein [Proteiniphilum sp.]MDD3908478.1 hypothetical protein [Proteiniphilum sp.]MDD4415967.1 hypothetical protein [Proteiniphilum sp.]